MRKIFSIEVEVNQHEEFEEDITEKLFQGIKDYIKGYLTEDLLNGSIMDNIDEYSLPILSVEADLIDYATIKIVLIDGDEEETLINFDGTEHDEEE